MQHAGAEALERGLDLALARAPGALGGARGQQALRGAGARGVQLRA